MGEIAAAAAPLGARLRKVGIELGLGAGSGVAGGIAGTLVSWLPALILLHTGSDYVSLPTAVSRVVVALLFVAAGVIVARLDLAPLMIGAGGMVGGVFGALFGPGEVAGFAGFLGAFLPGIVAGAVAGVGGAILSHTQVPPLTRREFNSLFLSPVAYVVGAIFLFVYGLFFYGYVARDGVEASIFIPMINVAIMLVFIAPILTMRLLAEEKRSGTIEVLMTAPVDDWEVVLSKFLAALSALGVMLVPTLIHVLILELVSERGISTPLLVGCYIAFVLTGGLFISLGLFASSLARDQIVAAIIGFVLCLGMFFVGMLTDWLGTQVFSGSEAVRNFLELIPFIGHFQRIANGEISTRGILYFVTLTAFALFVTVRIVESRKWR